MQVCKQAEDKFIPRKVRALILAREKNNYIATWKCVVNVRGGIIQTRVISLTDKGTREIGRIDLGYKAQHAFARCEVSAQRFCIIRKTLRVAHISNFHRFILKRSLDNYH